MRLPDPRPDRTGGEAARHIRALVAADRVAVAPLAIRGNQMPVLVATFGKPEDITNPGFDGTAFRFPVVVIDGDDIGTPRQPSKAKSLRIRIEVSRSRITAWGLSPGDLLKVAFEIAKEHITKVLNSGVWKGGDLEVKVNTFTHSGPCPFDPALIPVPEGAVAEIEVHRPIGFT